MTTLILHSIVVADDFLGDINVWYNHAEVDKNLVGFVPIIQPHLPQMEHGNNNNAGDKQNNPLHQSVDNEIAIYGWWKSLMDKV